MIYRKVENNMDTKAFIKICTTLDIEISFDRSVVREVTNDNEFDYGIEKSGLKWNIFSIQRGNKQIEYSYNCKNKALEKFILVLIKKKIISESVIPIMRNNPQLYEISISYVDVLKILKENDIDIEALEDYSLKLVKHDEQYVLNLVNKEKNEKTITCEMNREDALFVLLQKWVLLYKYISIVNGFQMPDIKINLFDMEKIFEFLTMD